MQILQPPITSSLLDQNILFCTLFSNTLCLFSTVILEATFHIHTCTNKICFVLTFTFFESRQEKSFRSELQRAGSALRGDRCTSCCGTHVSLAHETEFQNLVQEGQHNCWSRPVKVAAWCVVSARRIVVRVFLQTQLIAKDIYMQRDSVFNASCDLWTKLKTSLYSKCYRQYSHALRSKRCSSFREAQIRERVKFTKAHSA
jgi:hypothetical protein